MRSIGEGRIRRLVWGVKALKWMLILLASVAAIGWPIEAWTIAQLPPSLAEVAKTSGPPIPTWAIAALAAVGAIIAWKVEAFARKWLRITGGLCPSCGYDRSGLATDAPCPECGTSNPI